MLRADVETRWRSSIPYPYRSHRNIQVVTHLSKKDEYKPKSFSLHNSVHIPDLLLSSLKPN